MKKLSLILLIMFSIIVLLTGCNNDISGVEDNTATNNIVTTDLPNRTSNPNSNASKGDNNNDKPIDVNAIDPNNVTNSADKITGEQPYYIIVNVVSQIVTVYEKDANGYYTVPHKNFISSTGVKGNETPLGMFQIYRTRHEWMLMVDKSYGQYAVRFNGSILFHSIPYERKLANTLKWEEYNKLGTPASHGCVRLKLSDVKWIYDNCANGTIVNVLEGEAAPELLERLKPEPLAPNTYWDPTDPKNDGSTPPPKPKITPTSPPTPSPSSSISPTPTPTPTPTPPPNEEQDKVEENEEGTGDKEGTEPDPETEQTAEPTPTPETDPTPTSTEEIDEGEGTEDVTDESKNPVDVTDSIDSVDSEKSTEQKI